jgi:membrane protein DedA with SNARE-associated domain
MNPIESMPLPLGFSDWGAPMQAMALALLTFVQEDVPTVSAAVLSAAGGMPLGAAFLGCFLGIWTGDALLYGAARLAGPRLRKHSWSRRWMDPKAIQRAETWFAAKGVWVLLASRFLPGTRLPTYLAAGLLRSPFGRFVWITGLAAAVWTAGIFGAAHYYGPELTRHARETGWLTPAAVVLAALGLLHISGKVLARADWSRIRTAMERWARWEFWPAWLFYPPVALWCFFLGTKHRGWTLPTVANPGMELGGVVGESKIATLRDLASRHGEFTAEAFAVVGETAADRADSVRRILRETAMGYPFILKPDIGQRGAGVRFIREPDQLAGCLGQSPGPWILQRYAPGPFEAGVFYYRLPGESRGRIFSITEKIFPEVCGDGRHTVEELIRKEPRARFMADIYLRRLGTRRMEVPPEGDRVKLVEAGNHAQGCVFQDGWRLWSAALEDRIDSLSRSLTGFHIGRYDVRYASEEDFRSGRNFKVIELNGATAESTNIYDSNFGLWRAYRVLFRQWSLVYAIGAANRAAGWRPDPVGAVWRAWRGYARRAALYPMAD